MSHTPCYSLGRMQQHRAGACEAYGLGRRCGRQSLRIVQPKMPPEERTVAAVEAGHQDEVKFYVPAITFTLPGRGPILRSLDRLYPTNP